MEKYGQDKSKSFPEWKGPKWDSPLRTAETWLQSRRRENDDEDFWRIHDELYDLRRFAATHPGGAQWIELTKGTDITEVFESHHLTDLPRSLLPEYLVRKTFTKRNSPFTFKEDGFYCTLRRRIAESLKAVPKGSSSQSKMMADAMVSLTLLLSTLAAYNGSYLLAFLSGMCLCSTTVISHNFFHMKDNFRMYYFALSGFSVKGWRVSHGLSHHMFPNSRQDMEITLFEPFLQWTPRADKSVTVRFISWIYSPLVYVLLFHSQWILRVFFEPEGYLDLIPMVIPASMILFGGADVSSAFFWWTVIVLAGSLCFSIVGLNAAHHHPELLHDGDEPRNEKEMDWGTYQIDAVRDRVEIAGVFPLVISFFGDHTLHHLFPTIDHFHLNNLYPVLEETCREFGIDFKMGTIWDLIRGQFLQLARNYTISLKTKN